MKGWAMYQHIHQLKEEKLNKAQVARELGIDPRTVNRYWTMTPDEYAEYRRQTGRRKRKLDTYREQILCYLNRHNDYKTSQILDLLHEKYPHKKEEITYSTLRRYVNDLREEYHIPQKPTSRQYQAIPDPPYGYQAQVDLGFDTLKRPDGSHVELCALAMVLSRSRYKYIEWIETYPQTVHFINFHNRAFHFFGGLPEEIVYDQDRLLLVDENFGEVIYTFEFERYRQKMKFKTFITRGRDPESKGRIESVVKYVKGNFAKHRTYLSLDALNRECLGWLERTGNGRKHGTTKKVPAEVFTCEKRHLRPVPETRMAESSTKSITRIVRKDNTVVYLANRYTVPLGTYEPGKEVELQPADEKLKILELDTGELIATHKISQKKGQLIQNTNHLRDRSSSIEKMKKDVLEAIGDTEKTRHFISRIEQDFPRYIRDQYALIITTSSSYEPGEIKQAITYLVENEMFTAGSYRSALANLSKIPEKKTVDVPSLPAKYQLETEIRELSEYERAD